MTSTAVSPPLLLGLTDVLRELGVSRRELDAWRRQGVSPRFVRLPNGQLRMKESVLRAWIDEGVPHPLPSVTVAQAAAEFGVEVSVFAAWVSNGRIPGVSVDLPSDGRIPRVLLDAWVEALPER
jgi:hypothetical protein